MDRTSKIILGATAIGIAALFAWEYADKMAERQIVDSERLAARSRIARAKQAETERASALTVALPDIERRLRNADATKDHEGAYPEFCVRGIT